MLFFISACCVTAAGVLSIISGRNVGVGKFESLFLKTIVENSIIIPSSIPSSPFSPHLKHPSKNPSKTAAATLDAPFDFVNYAYLTIFGLIMMVLDVPVYNGFVDRVKAFVQIYALFMTRFVGRGVW